MFATAYLARRKRRLLLDGTGRIGQIRIDAKGCHGDPREALRLEVPLVDDDLLYIRVGGLLPVRFRCGHGVDLRRQSIRFCDVTRQDPVWQKLKFLGIQGVVDFINVAIHSSHGPLTHFGNKPNIHFQCCDAKGFRELGSEWDRVRPQDPGIKQ